MTWILMEIPYHFLSQLDLVAVWSKSTPNSMQIPCHLSRFYLFPCWNMTWILDKVKSWNFHGICEENDGISIEFGLSFEPNQTAVKTTWKNPCHIFYRGCIIWYLLFSVLFLFFLILYIILSLPFLVFSPLRWGKKWENVKFSGERNFLSLTFFLSKIYPVQRLLMNEVITL